MRQHQRTEEARSHARRSPSSGRTRSGPQALARTPAGVLALQRAAGNAAVNRALSSREPTQVQRMFAAQAQGGQNLRAQQHERLAMIPAVYVPEELFGADGSLPPMPTVAYLAPQRPNDVEALGELEPNLPRPAGRRGNAPEAAWEGTFRSEYFVYRIQLINAPGQGIGINENAPFTILDRTIKRTVDHAKNRTFAFEQRWAPNPAFWAAPELETDLSTPAGREFAARVGQDYGLEPSQLMPAGGLPLFRALPTESGRPFIFYVKHSDPKFATDNRSYLSDAGFDQLAADPTSGLAAQSMIGLSTRPQVDRQQAGRSPQQAMGGIPAHQFMGAAGRAGQQGQLSSHEWCHLIGDGDGGPAVFQNLVIGTNAVNTEQLAMESALRRYVPRFRTLGVSIQLRVTALTAEPPVSIPVPGVTHRQAKWISYQIGLVPLGDTNNAAPEVVHRQIMDAERGTISSGEFTFLHSLVAEKLRNRAMALNAARNAQPAAAPAPAGV